MLIRTIRLMLFSPMIMAFALVARADEVPQAKYLPSPGGVTFNSSHYNTFNEYLEQAKLNVIKHKIYLDEEHRNVELAISLPFEIRPSNCGDVTKGIVLIHGLSDTPYAIKDLAIEFASRCFAVRGVLLPGHGTRAGDLLKVTKEDWINAVKFSVDSFKGSVDEVYVGGYSLGGLLAVNAAANDSDIKAVFAFSPAIGIANAPLVWHSKWVRYFLDWVDTGKRDDLVRYEAMTYQAAAEIYDLSADLQDQLERNKLTTPVFLAQSSDDETIDSDVNKRYFIDTFSNDESVLLSYNSEDRLDKDGRIVNVNVRDYANRIVSYSHQSVHTSPYNSYYGANGEYRNCGINATDRTEAELTECYTSPTPWLGEVKDYSGEVPFNPRTLGRLTYNPKFDEMMVLIDLFLTQASVN